MPVGFEPLWLQAVSDSPWQALGRFVSLGDANVRWVLFGTALLGLAGGALGSFALLRRRALMGDALSHAALPGVCLAFLFTASKDPGFLLLGAAFSAAVGSLAIGAITRWSRVKEDAALALVLSVMFGIGISLLTWIQRHPRGDPSGLDRFIFGQAAALLPRDLELMAALTLALCALLWLLFKEFKLISFDPDYGAALGFPVRRLEALLAAMLVLGVVVGLQAVGVVLMAAMLVIPAAAARQWTDRLGVMVALSGIFGMVSGALGSLFSFLAPHLPTGPVMVLTATAVFVVSLFVSPRRGLLVSAYRILSTRARFEEQNLLKALYRIEEERLQDPPHIELEALEGARLEEIAAHRRLPVRRVLKGLSRLVRKGLVAPVAASDGRARRWRLTATGLTEARRLVRSHRLWEVYLVERAELAHDHVHRDAEAAEHVIGPEVVQALEERLGAPLTDVHGRPIPSEDRGVEERNRSRGGERP